MISILPDILRAIVTDVMLVLLLYTISTPKYKNSMPYVITTLILLAVNLSANIYYYIQGSYTAVVFVDFIMLLFISVALRPLFLERTSHWIFGFITVLNVYSIIVFLTWITADFFPFSKYANTILRLCLFSGVIVVFRRFVLPIYRSVLESWHIYIPLLIVLFINIAYYFLYGDDVEMTLTVGQWPMFLLIALGACIYISIFYAMKATLREYELREENQIMKSQEALLENELASHNEFIEQARQYRHDLRHHNALLMEYLSSGDVDGAKEYLRQYDGELKNSTLTDYCKNPVANAVMRRCAWRADQAGVTFTVQADIPEVLPLAPQEIGVMLANLLENACEACEKSKAADRFIIMTAESEEDRMKIKVQNTVEGKAIFDESGMPKTTKPDGGTGTQSIKRIVKKYGGMLIFCQSENTFITRIILPLK